MPYQRSQVLATLALAPPAQLRELATWVPDWPSYELLLGPQLGTLLLPARADVEGDPFCLTDLLVTQVHIRDARGYEGLGWLLGDDAEHALWIARWDALLQDTSSWESWGRLLMEALQKSIDDDNACQHAQYRATQVDFFNLENME